MGSVDVSIVTWNSAAVLPRALESLVKQTLKPQSITVVDNGSTDASVRIATALSSVDVLQLHANHGFAGGHNHGIRQGSADYVLVMNPDVTLEPTYLATLVTFADAHPDAAAFVGRVERPGGAIDTAGIAVTPWRVVRDRTDVPEKPHEVFGVSGAVALYRRTALRDVAVQAEFFCSLLLAYKEDVELAWRLRWAGWRAFCVPSARAQHARGVQREQSRRARPSDLRYLSYRNHLLLFGLVESFGTFMPHAGFILLAEFVRLGFLLCIDPRTTLRALADARKMWHAARTFARTSTRRASARTMRAAFA